MKHPVPELDPERWREIALAMPAGVAYVTLAAAVHWLEQPVPLSRAEQVAYWTLVVLLAGRYLLWARIPAAPSLSADLPLLLVGLAAATGLGWLQRSVPTLFFYLWLSKEASCSSRRRPAGYGSQASRLFPCWWQPHT